MPIQGFSTSNRPWILRPPLWCPFSRQEKVARKYSRPFLVQYQWLHICPSRPFHPLYSREPHPPILGAWTTMSLPLSPPMSWIYWEHPTPSPSPLYGKPYITPPSRRSQSPPSLSSRPTPQTSMLAARWY